VGTPRKHRRLEEIEARRRTHDVDDRVDRAHLVKMHLRERHAVHLGFGLGEPPKDRARQAPRPRRQLGPGDQRVDLRVAALRLLPLDPHLEVTRADGAGEAALDLDAEAAQ
jgi:hypothetical protein